MGQMRNEESAKGPEDCSFVAMFDFIAQHIRDHIVHVYIYINMPVNILWPHSFLDGGKQPYF